jgi:hypothetical protein
VGECHGARPFNKSSPTQQKVALLERAVLRFAARFEIQSFENQGLWTAITQKKKKRQRNKRLNLLGEQDEGVPQFFSPQRVLAAKAFQENKEVAEEEDKRQKTLQKEEAAHKRQEMEAEKQERAIQRQLRQIANKEEKEAERHEKRSKGRRNAAKMSKTSK